MALDQLESEMLSTWLNLWRSSFWGPTSQSWMELRIQDGGAHESQPCWKTALQPRRRTGIALTDFHGGQKCWINNEPITVGLHSPLLLRRAWNVINKRSITKMRWPCGPMDKAIDYGSRDSRFESWWRRSFLKLMASLSPLPLNKHNVQETK